MIKTTFITKTGRKLHSYEFERQYHKGGGVF
jgi:hypothetical protein